MGIRRRIGSEAFSTQLRCDLCGRPAVWRDRVITACCLYGEVLCDRCEAKRLVRQAQEDNFWADIADFVVTPFRKLAGVIVATKSANLPPMWRTSNAEFVSINDQDTIRRPTGKTAGTS